MLWWQITLCCCFSRAVAQTKKFIVVLLHAYFQNVLNFIVKKEPNVWLKWTYDNMIQCMICRLYMLDMLRLFFTRFADKFGNFDISHYSRKPLIYITYIGKIALYDYAQFLNT